MPASSPFHPPNPCITVNATFNTWGSVTTIPQGVLNIQPSGALGSVDSGTTQYTDSLTETILMPDGSTVTFAENSQDNGTFIIAILI